MPSTVGDAFPGRNSHRSLGGGTAGERGAERARTPPTARTAKIVIRRATGLKRFELALGKGQVLGSQKRRFWFRLRDRVRVRVAVQFQLQSIAAVQDQLVCSPTVMDCKCLQSTFVWTASACSPYMLDCLQFNFDGLQVHDQIGLRTCAVQMAHWSATLAVQGTMDCTLAQSRWTTGLQRCAVGLQRCAAGLQRSAVQVYLTLSTAWTAHLRSPASTGLQRLQSRTRLDCIRAQSRWLTGLQRLQSRATWTANTRSPGGPLDCRVVQSRCT